MKITANKNDDENKDTNNYDDFAAVDNELKDGKNVN